MILTVRFSVKPISFSFKLSNKADIIVPLMVDLTPVQQQQQHGGALHVLCKTFKRAKKNYIGQSGGVTKQFDIASARKQHFSI